MYQTGNIVRILTLRDSAPAVFTHQFFAVPTLKAGIAFLMEALGILKIVIFPMDQHNHGAENKGIVVKRGGCP